MSIGTLKALDFVNNHEALDLSLLDDTQVRDNLVILASKDEEMANNLVGSLADAVAQAIGVLEEDEQDEQVESFMREIGEEGRKRISSACDMTMAVGYAYSNFYPVMATFGFSCRYNLTMTGLGVMVLKSIQIGLPPEQFMEFLQSVDVQVETDGIDWDAPAF